MVVGIAFLYSWCPGTVSRIKRDNACFSQVLPLLQLTGARGDMAARNQPNASDSFVEQLLRSGPDVSGHDHTEAEAEEVDYGETDEDAQDAEGPHRVDRGRGARRWATSVLG